jgi:hypothetical protein
MTKEFLIKARNYCRSDESCFYCPYKKECDENGCAFDEMSDDEIAEDIHTFSKKNVIDFAFFMGLPETC